MKVYRGPTTTNFDHESHQVVDEIDLVKDLKPWTGSKLIPAKLSKSKGVERSSIAHIELTSEDIIALHSSLMQGLQEKEKELRFFAKNTLHAFFGLSDMEQRIKRHQSSNPGIYHLEPPLIDKEFIESIAVKVAKVKSELPSPHIYDYPKLHA